MKQRTLALGLLCATSLLGACNSSGAGVLASTSLDDLHDHIGQLQDAMETHSADVQTAKSLAGVVDMENKHAAEAAKLMGDMKADMDGMAMCADSSGQMAGSGGMEQMMADAKTECEEHKAAMAAAPDMMAAGTEEARHHGAMSDLLGKMKMAEADMADNKMMGSDGMGMCSMGQ